MLHPGRRFKSRARNHLQANRLLEFRVGGHAVGTGYGDALVISHREGGVPARLSAVLAHPLDPSSGESARNRDPGARPRHDKILQGWRWGSEYRRSSRTVLDDPTEAER